ncbi:cell wall anchored protein [Apiospora arundinis]|uniref:Cell wall anchored protein n=1 Tax=Apiospora arundinis TaxID=335852 RepID=A0ABR2J9S1_9PEZI
MPLVTLIVVSLLTTANAQKDPVGSFCRRFGHQTTVIDRKMYIDGGFINYSPVDIDPTNYTNSDLSYLDLDHNGTNGMPQLYANLSKNNSIPSVHGGVLWGDDVNKRFYLFGGEYSQQQPPADSSTPPLYAYDVLSNRWDLVGHASATVSAVSYGAGVAISETGEGYYYGGWLSNASVPGWKGPRTASTGLIRYTMDTNELINITGPNDGIRRAEGAMVYLPVSDGGMLVYFGGIQDPGNGSLVGQPMNEIHLYDIQSRVWYVQDASGDNVPDMRRRFCAGSTWAQDQSSYNIYLYGGLGFEPNNTAGFDDVYILSLPSFTWLKMYPPPGTGQQKPHHTLSCNVIDGAQMLIMGGYFPLNATYCDTPDQYGTHGLDMGEQNPSKSPWFVYRKDITSYIVPQLILDAIGGRPQGGATKTAPSHGFNEPDVKVLMTRRFSAPVRTPTRNVNGSDGTSHQGGGLSKDATIGIGVGVGVGGAALLAFIVGCCCLGVIRRRRKHRRDRAAAGPAGTPSMINNAVAPSGQAAARNSGYTFMPSPGAVGSPSLHWPTQSPPGSPPYPMPYYNPPALAPAPPNRALRAPAELVGSEGMHELHDRRQYGTPHFSLSTPAAAMMMPPPPKYMDHDDTMTPLSSPPTTMATTYSWSRRGSPVTAAEAAGAAHTTFYNISPLATTPTTETMQQQAQQQHNSNNSLSFPNSWFEAGSEHNSYGPLSSNPVAENQQQPHHHHQEDSTATATATATTPQTAASASPPGPPRNREQPRVQARDGGISATETDGEAPRHQTYYHN